MSDNRNTILAVVLSGLVLLGWQYFFNIPQMEKQRAAELAAKNQATSQLANPAQPPAQPGAQPGAPAPQADLVAEEDCTLALLRAERLRELELSSPADALAFYTMYASLFESHPAVRS